MDAPDLSSMQQDKPNPSEEIQHRLGARAQERFMKETVGTKESPGSARFLSQRIDEMSSPARVNEQLGRVSGRAQQEFGKQNLWRTAALGRTTGSGAASNALRTGFTGLQSGLTAIAADRLLPLVVELRTKVLAVASRFAPWDQL